MLQNIRDHLQGVVAWVLLGALALVFALWGATGIVDFNTGGNASYAAKVKSDLPWWKPAAKIGAEDVNRAYRNQITQYQQMMRGEIPAELRTQLQESLLEDFVRNEILTQHSIAVGYRVSDEQVVKSYQEIPAFQIEGKYSADAAHSRLAQVGMTPAAFDAEQRKALQMKQLQDALSDSVFVTPAELERARRLQGEQREATWLVIPAAGFLDRIQPEEAAIQAYYDGHKNEFMTPETVALRYIRFRLEDVAQQVKVTDEDLRAYFETVKDLYLYLDGPQKGKQKSFEDARAELEGEYRKQEAEKLFGERQEKLADKAFENLNDLDAVAKELGLAVHEIPVFRKDFGGGDLIARQEIIEAAFSENVLNGENSRPIELTPGDVVVLRASGYRAPEQRPLAEVRETIVAALKKQQSQQQARELALQSAARLEAGSERFERLSADVKGKLEGPKFVGRTDEAMPIEVRNVLFAAARPTAEKPAIYKAVPLGNGDAAVVKLSGVRIDAAPETPEQLTARVQQLRQQTATAEMAGYMAALRSKAKVAKNSKVFE